MKSYFARLTARVAPLHQMDRPSMRATDVHDPFEESASPETLLPPPSSPAEQTVSKPQSVRAIAPAQQRGQDNTRAVGQSPSTVANELGQHPAEVSVLTPRPMESGNGNGAGDAEMKISARQVDQTKRLTPENRNPNADVNLPSDDPREPKSSVFENSQKPSVRPSEPASRHDPSESAADAESSEAILLRKADAFMKGLFERRVSHEQATEPDTASLPAVAEPLHPPVQAQQRLAPAPAVRPVPNPEPEQPSLRIGKLTVEVVPQAPIAPARPERIIVKQSSGRVSGGVPSSRRFGLSQF